MENSHQMSSDGKWSIIPDLEVLVARVLKTYPLNNMTYRLVKRKKASQLAVMLATPSHAIESV